MLQLTVPTPLPPAEIPSPRSSADRTCRWVAFCVARDFGLEPADLLGPTRGAPRVAFARQVAMYVAHIGFRLSIRKIGRIFGRDRATVAHACRVVEDSRDDIWLDCRLEVLELFCRWGWDALLQSKPEFAR